MLRNNANVRQCIYFEPGLPVVIRDSFGQNSLELRLLKQLSIKPTRQLMRFAWRTETMVLPDHKVAVTEKSQDCLTNSKVITKGGTTRSSPKTHINRKTSWILKFIVLKAIMTESHRSSPKLKKLQFKLQLILRDLDP